MLGIEPESARYAGDTGANVKPLLDARRDQHPDAVVLARRLGGLHVRLSNGRDEQVGFDSRSVILPVSRRCGLCGGGGRIGRADGAGG